MDRSIIARSSPKNKPRRKSIFPRASTLALSTRLPRGVELKKMQIHPARASPARTLILKILLGLSRARNSSVDGPREPGFDRRSVAPHRDYFKRVGPGAAATCSTLPVCVCVCVCVFHLRPLWFVRRFFLILAFLFLIASAARKAPPTNTFQPFAK